MILPIITLIFITSCVPVYKCGDPVPKEKLRGSKRLKDVVTERDKLCKENANLNKELNKTKSSLSQLQDSYNQLQKKSNELIDETLSKTDYLTSALKLKEEELAAREKSLKEMQAIIARQDSITKHLNNILHDALLGFSSDELSVEIKNGKVYISMSDKLLFKSGSASVETKGKEALKVLAEVLNKNTETDILIEGHTDNVPIKTSVYKDNWDLSVARATSIVRILCDDYKITPTRMTAAGRGEFFPRADNETPEGRAKNRRTEIILSPKLDELLNLLQTD